MRLASKIAVFTLVEDVALVVWLAAVRAGHRIGALILPIGFFIEHVIADNVKNGMPLLNLWGIPKTRIFINGLIETAVWIAWLLLWPLYPFALFGVGIPFFAILFLQVALTIEHNVTDNIFHGRPLFRDLFNKRVYGFTTLENIGATSWLGLIGAGHPIGAVIALVVFQFLEHQRAIVIGRKP